MSGRISQYIRCQIATRSPAFRPSRSNPTWSRRFRHTPFPLTQPRRWNTLKRTAFKGQRNDGLLCESYKTFSSGLHKLSSLLMYISKSDIFKIISPFLRPAELGLGLPQVTHPQRVSLHSLHYGINRIITNNTTYYCKQVCGEGRNVEQSLEKSIKWHLENGFECVWHFNTTPYNFQIK